MKPDKKRVRKIPVTYIPSKCDVMREIAEREFAIWRAESILKQFGYKIVPPQGRP